MRDGKWLERLVAEIERLLLPAGLTVTVGKRQFLESGKQEAEFDVVIAGTVGSGEYRWLIECRDRPSGGAAPASWIEQLAGRRQNFGYNKVSAVSSSGFSEGALIAAERLGIDTRSLEQLVGPGLTKWIEKFTLCYSPMDANLIEIRLRPTPEVTAVELSALSAVLRGTNHYSQIFFSQAHGSRLSGVDLLGNFVQEADLFDRLNVGEESKRVTLSIHFTNPADRYVVETDAGNIPIEHVEMVTDLTSRKYAFTLKDAKAYTGSESKKAIAEIAMFEAVDEEARSSIGPIEVRSTSVGFQVVVREKKA